MRVEAIQELQLRPTEFMTVTGSTVPVGHPGYKVTVEVTDARTGRSAVACGRSILDAREEALRKLRGGQA